jgi:thiamine biosynthesis protein ThiC
MPLDDDLRQAIDERLAARIADVAERTERRREQLAELSRRRRHGLEARHRTKIARQQEDTE